MEWSFIVANISNFERSNIKKKNQTLCLNCMIMAPFDLHEVIIGHITPEIYRRTDNGVTIAGIGVETSNF